MPIINLSNYDLLIFLKTTIAEREITARITNTTIPASPGVAGASEEVSSDGFEGSSDEDSSGKGSSDEDSSDEDSSGKGCSDEGSSSSPGTTIANCC